MQLKLAGVVKESVVDGPGIRLVVFVQGCPHHCQGCHNPASHDPAGGYIASTEELLAELDKNRLISGLTLSGGEPFGQLDAMIELASGAKERKLSVMVYTGYVFDELMTLGTKDKRVGQLLNLTDILVDGPFMIELRDISLAFRGSGNQRLIDVPASLQQGGVVEWMDPAWQY